MSRRDRRTTAADLRRFSELLSLFDQQTGSLNSSNGFWCRVAADMEEGVYEGNLELDLLAAPAGVSGKSRSG